MKKVISLLIIIIILVSVNFGQDTANLLVRLLRFEKSLGSRTSGMIDIVIVYNNNYKESANEAVRIATQFGKMSDKTVNRKAFKFIVKLYTPNIKNELDNVEVVYICERVDPDVIIATSKKNKILTIASSENFIENVAVVIREDEQKNKLHIKEKLLKEEGVNLSEQILKISRLY